MTKGRQVIPQDMLVCQDLTVHRSRFIRRRRPFRPLVSIPRTVADLWRRRCIHTFAKSQEENNMELRLITEPGDREVFASRMSQARAFRNGGFRETDKSCIGKIHLQFGNAYGLFDDDSPHPDQMIAGFIMHDQASFALSHSKPDFSHYRPEAVFEIGEMWSLAKGAGICAQYGAVILLGLMQAQAVVGYAIVKPWDLSGFY